MPKMPNFRYDVQQSALAEASPVSVGPSSLGATVDKIVQVPNTKKEKPSIIREKSKKNSHAFGSLEWMEQQALEIAKTDTNAKTQAEVRKTDEAKELDKRVKEKKERRKQLEALSKAKNSPEQNSPVESSDSPVESSSAFKLYPF